MAVIDRRQAADGSVTYRVRVRRRGLPLRTATLRRLAEARARAAQQEAGLEAQSYFPDRLEPHTVREALDRYAHLTDQHTAQVAERMAQQFLSLQGGADGTPGVSDVITDLGAD
ncbi:MAG: hypothetical protein AB7N91_04760 [Candidatus Tectimicrobiota bacterium]